MARMGRRAQQRRRNEIILGIVFFGIVIGTIGAGAYYSLSREKPLNEQTLCPDEGPRGHYVFLVDKTDPLNFTQKYAFISVVHELVEKRLPKGFLLSVFVLGEDYTQVAEPLIELCNPGSDDGASEFTANLDKLRKQYEDRFLHPLLARTDELVAIEPAKSSPIFEMIQLVGINGFRRHDVSGERRLIIMSDMLHNTASYSMYQLEPDYVQFHDSDYGRKARAALPDVEVELHYLINSPRLQTRRNLKFWEDYFSASGARIVLVNPLEG